MSYTLHDFWIDPVWSKVLSVIILTILGGSILLAIGHRKLGDFAFFRILTVKIPSWYFFLALIVLLGLNLTLNNWEAFNYLLIFIVLAITNIIFYRRSNNKSSTLESPTLTANHKSTAVLKIENGEYQFYNLTEAKDFSLKSNWEKRWENGKTEGSVATGTFSFDPDNIINIQRTNIDGRLIVKITRYNGPNLYFIDKNLSHNGNRTIIVSFEAKTIGGQHKLWFMAKKPGLTDWVHNANVWFTINTNVWKPYRNHFTVPANEDFDVHFENRDLLTAPSSIQIRKLIISEPVE